MTAYSAIARGLARKHSNRKDGPIMKRRRQNFEAYGFTLLEPPAKWGYTWDGDFPVFTLAPGVLGGKQGLVARCEQPEEAIYFVYGTPAEEIKAVLDEAILGIMRHQAALIEAELDYDEWCESDIYEEVDF